MIGFIALLAIAAGDTWTLNYSVRYVDVADAIETLNKDELDWQVLESSPEAVTFNEKRVFLGTQIGDDLIPPAKGAVPEVRKVSTKLAINPESNDADTRRLDRVLWGIPFSKAPDTWQKTYPDPHGPGMLAKVEYTVTSASDQRTQLQVVYSERDTDVSLEGTVTVANSSYTVQSIHLVGHSVRIPSSDYRADLTIDGTIKKPK